MRYGLLANRNKLEAALFFRGLPQSGAFEVHHQISFIEQDGGKWRAFCSCGPEGLFDSKQKAQEYMNFHVGKIGVAFGVNTVGWSEQALPMKQSLKITVQGESAHAANS